MAEAPPGLFELLRARVTGGGVENSGAAAVVKEREERAYAEYRRKPADEQRRDADRAQRACLDQASPPSTTRRAEY